METKTNRLACGYIEKSMVVTRLVLKASGAPHSLFMPPKYTVVLPEVEYIQSSH